MRGPCGTVEVMVDDATLRFIPPNPPLMAPLEILCASDLTPASDVALHYAVMLAGKLGAPVTHLHILGKDDRGPGARAALETVMAERRKRFNDGEVAGTSLLLEGDVIKGIAEETAKRKGFLVAGTHGAKGLRQSLFGADMLKLVKRSALPAVVVQKESTVSAPERIVMPVAPHADIDRLVDAVCLLARTFGSEVHLYQLARLNDEPSPELLANKARTVERLGKEGIKCMQPVEPSATFSIGFAQATIDYAERIGAGLIAVMAKASDEFHYLADTDKERMLTNTARIPVLYA